MRLKGVRVGFAMTGSHCCLEDVMPQVRSITDEGAEVIPIISSVVSSTDTKFGPASKWKGMLKEITGREAIDTQVGAEPIGPQKILDVMVVAPCTGNTLAKLANGITDTPVLMAVKAQLRNQRPVVLAISTNDGLSMNAKNLGLLLNAKNVYIVPFRQDNPSGKPNSIVARWDFIAETILHALQGKQVQPVLVAHG